MSPAGAAGLGLFAAAAAVVLSASLGFAAGRPLSALHLAAGAMAGVAAVLWATAARRRPTLAALAVASAAVAGALLVAPLRYDTSWDGLGYHQEAVLALARGWNPLREPRAPADFTAHRYVTHMAKGSWVVAAALYRATHRIEAAKALGLVLLTAALLASWAALRAVPDLGALAAGAAAVLAALNPVAGLQAFTFYVDGQVASALTAFTAFAFLAVRGVRGALAGMVAATIVLTGAKLTGVPYAVLAWAAAVAAAAGWSGRRRAAVLGAAGGAALAVSVLGAGYSPYVTNTLLEGHPFYPAAGPRAWDFMKGSRAPGLDEMSRAGRLLVSTFAVASGDPAAPPRLKLPFTLVEDEATKFWAPDVRLAGFGPLASGALLLALLAAALARRTAAVPAALLALALLGSALVTAEGWWARFAPQLWLVPVVLALAPLAAPGRRGARLAGALALAALGANVGLVLVNNLNRNRPVQREVRAQLAALAASPEPVPVHLGFNEAVAVRLDEAGVRWTPATALPCDRPVRMAGTISVELCPPAQPAR